MYFFIEISRDSLEKEAWSLKNADWIVVLLLLLLFFCFVLFFFFFLSKFNCHWLNPLQPRWYMLEPYNPNLRFTVGLVFVYFEKTYLLKPYAKIKQTWKGHWQWNFYTKINNYWFLSSRLLASFGNQ